VKKIIIFLSVISFSFSSTPSPLESEIKIQKDKKIEFTPQWPHGDIIPIFPDVFFVTGTNKIQHDGHNIQDSRNMIVIRYNNELTLINTVRLDEKTLNKMDMLGQVKNIVKIGSFHGRDDAFYLDRYKSAQLWALKGMKHNNDIITEVEFSPFGKMPFPNCSLFVFDTPSHSEGIIHIDKEGGILITCDSIKNWTHIDQFFNEETGKDFMNKGLIKSGNIDSVWINEMHPKKSDFERLLNQFKFRHLLSAHGDPLLNDAHKIISDNISQLKLDN
jgi:hypothetical protein